jgi:NAD(P)-dependent dehydrogenase (short-subunit alcohol dehydrogenase family)
MNHLQQGYIGPSERFRGRVALITGAGRGIGEAIAIQFAAQGAHVVLCARTRSELESVAGHIRTSGGLAQVVACDVADPAQVSKLVKSTLETSRRIDILVNAAGIYGPIGPIWEVGTEEWKRAIDINLYGTFLVCQSVVPHMIAARKGAIINFSGGGATAPLPRFSAYGVSKAAVIRLTETLAEEVREYNIRVNAIAPGAIDTRLQDEAIAAGARAGALGDRIKRMRDTGEGATPISVPAALAVFLASESARGLTGKLISAPHDKWENWDDQRISEIMSQAWFTLRRIDEFTLRPLLEGSSAVSASHEKVRAGR